MGYLVLFDNLLDYFGFVVFVGCLILMYGFSGNGKFLIFNGICDFLGDKIFVLCVVEYVGQVIIVYDFIVYFKVESEGGGEDCFVLCLCCEFDMCYVCCECLIVVIGGELMLDMLDLVYNFVVCIYQVLL